MIAKNHDAPIARPAACRPKRTGPAGLELGEATRLPTAQRARSPTRPSAAPVDPPARRAGALRIEVPRAAIGSMRVWAGSANVFGGIDGTGVLGHGGQPRIVCVVVLRTSSRLYWAGHPQGVPGRGGPNGRRGINLLSMEGVPARQAWADGVHHCQSCTS